MQTPTLPATKDVVLIGGGHAHALVLRSWGLKPLAGARVTVINPGPTAPYSGMLPGFVAGHYDLAALDIDLVQLARFAGARVILGRATGIDRENKQITVPGQPPIAFDVASVDVGITSDMPLLSGFRDHAVPAKPLGPFAAKWDAFRAGDGPAHVAVIGGGVAGAELILAMAYSLRERGRLGTTTLIDSAAALTAIPEAAARIVRNQLSALGVSLIENAKITRVWPHSITLTDGREVQSDFTTGAAGARPYGWLQETGLALSDGFVDVNAMLQSSDPHIFATGDCAHLTQSPRPKAGVYAVRQAPILYHNLRAMITGDRLKPYKAQKDYLKLISLGGKSALGEKFGTPFSGPQIWRWKNHIDQSFMAQFRDLIPQDPPKLPAEYTEDLPNALANNTVSGSCKTKLDHTSPAQHLPCQTRCADIEHLQGDSAAMVDVQGKRQVVVTDHMTMLTLDPILNTRIAASHALGRIWATGAQPKTATVTVTLPPMTPSLQSRTLQEVMTVAAEVFEQAGAQIITGHSAAGQELALGFTVTGDLQGPASTLAGAQPGDALILTKALGTGVLWAAERQAKANGGDLADAIAQMLRPLGPSAQILSKAHAMTHVGSLGLLGHLQALCAASNCGAQITTHHIPVLPGVASLLDAGLRAPLDCANRTGFASDRTAPDVLFDPQTCGGLLAAVAPDYIDAVIDALDAQDEPAAVIGQITNKTGDIQIIA
ncbi:selenide, water dikinase SelD [Epibacterium sp. SM1979]|uniref:Selenide, water dikinase SelD n=1 Tax=Tritonibacter litoralis TaxID=2662264 RepID=A0A843YFV4_9RHOB|nr:selenide, water dikinase SelD [Tritonibacter litoralis]MQQ09986.1 selenide, water dikinase SelD [Tritonibacter litoralis]